MREKYNLLYAKSTPGDVMRIAVFIDYWNFQLTLNQKVGALRGQDTRVKVDWRNLGKLLATEACGVLSVDPGALSYEGCYVYTSFNPATEEGKKFKAWATNWLDRQPGINVELRERRRKSAQRCPSCHQEIVNCPHAGCGKPIIASEEKGVDTFLVTDLLRLGLSNSYDAAVLASLDADMVPAVQYIQTTGKKVVQAGFPPQGTTLATECWGSFNVMDVAAKLERE